MATEKSKNDFSKAAKDRGYSDEEIATAMKSFSDAEEFSEYDDEVINLSDVKDNKTYIRCNNCGYHEEVNKKLFTKILGGAVAGFGFWAWVSFFFAGCGFALPLCIAIVTGGVAIAAYAKEIGDWLSKKYECPGCKHKDWTVLTGKELRLQGEVESSCQEDGSYNAIEFIPVMREVYDDAEEFIYLSCPWWNLEYVKQDLPLMKKAISRGVHIYFYFGIKPEGSSKEFIEQQERKNIKTARAIKYLQDNLNKRYTHFVPSHTHVKDVVCEKYALWGSHNFMNYRVREGEEARGEAMTKMIGESIVNTKVKEVESQPSYPGFYKYFEMI